MANFGILLSMLNPPNFGPLAKIKRYDQTLQSLLFGRACRPWHVHLQYLFLRSTEYWPLTCLALNIHSNVTELFPDQSFHTHPSTTMVATQSQTRKEVEATAQPRTRKKAVKCKFDDSSLAHKPSSIPLNTLPVEILRLIFESGPLSFDDYKMVSLVCKLFHTILRSCIFRTLVLGVDEEEPGREWMVDLAGKH